MGLLYSIEMLEFELPRNRSASVPCFRARRAINKCKQCFCKVISIKFCLVKLALYWWRIFARFYAFITFVISLTSPGTYAYQQTQQIVALVAVFLIFYSHRNQNATGMKKFAKHVELIYLTVYFILTKVYFALNNHDGEFHMNY